MFNQPTTFIVGAGASFEFGLPVGETLKAEIIASLPTRRSGFGSPPVHRVIRNQFIAADMEALMRAIEQIVTALPLYTSIDRFMDAFQDDPMILEISKIAITAAILRAEESSILATKQATPLSVSVAEKSWLHILYRFMQDGAKRTNIVDVFKNVRFVVYNYDRCIEHFIFHALQTANTCTARQAADAMKDLTIIHPYGRIGSLPWERIESDEPTIPYGCSAGELPQQLVIEAAKQIKTFTEQVEDHDPTMTQAKAAVQQAQKLVFLGFSYLDQNMKYVTPALKAQVIAAFGTTYGLSDADRDIGQMLIKNVLAGGTGDPTYVTPSMVPQTAAKFMTDYGNSLRR